MLKNNPFGYSTSPLVNKNFAYENQSFVQSETSFGADLPLNIEVLRQTSSLESCTHEPNRSNILCCLRPFVRKKSNAFSRLEGKKKDFAASQVAVEEYFHEQLQKEIEIDKKDYFSTNQERERGGEGKVGVHEDAPGLVTENDGKESEEFDLGNGCNPTHSEEGLGKNEPRPSSSSLRNNESNEKGTDDSMTITPYQSTALNSATNGNRQKKLRLKGCTLS